MTIRWKPRTLLILSATVAYWIVMCVGTHVPHVPGGGGQPGGNTDKLYHFGAFLGLAILVCFCVRCFGPLRRWHYVGVVGAIAIYGGIDELTQRLVINRTADPLDWLADVSGATLGAAIFAMFSQRTSHGATG